MKRPGVVWAYSIMVLLGIVFSVIGSVQLISQPLARIISPVDFYAGIFDLILTIPLAIFIYMFFMLKKSSLTWLYVSFGLSALTSLVAQSWFTAIIIIIFGWVVWDYISHKKVDGTLVFT